MAKGDHIYTSIYNNSSPYHHGIDCGNETVIHYQKHYKNEDSAIIIWVSMTEFAKGKKIYKKHYDKCDSPLIVVERAKRMLGEKKYNLFYHNCEHFAHYCKTGSDISPQVENAKKLFGDKGIATLNAVYESGMYSINSVKSAANTTHKHIDKVFKDILKFGRNDDEDDNDRFLELV